MAAETINAPLRREQTSFAQGRAPDIEFPPAIVHSVKGALDDASCRIERLVALFAAARAEMHDIVSSLPSAGGDVSPGVVSRLYENWLVIEVAGEKLDEMEGVVAAITARAYADRRELAA